MGFGGHQFVDGLPPFVAVVCGRRTADLDMGFPGVTGRAKRLAIRRVISQIRTRPDRLDMVDFKTATGTAEPAREAVAFQHRHAKGFPARAARDVPRMADHAHATLAFRSGCASIR